jgi:hypothetical protein
MEIKTIPRETDGTAKGVTLQKLRAASLLLQQVQDDPLSDFMAAIEYGGDIYIDGKETYIEEDKFYESKDFSISSKAVKNTMVYFLDYWLTNDRNSKIKFGFYSTNGIASENLIKPLKEQNVILPPKPILELLQSGDYTDPNLLPSVKAIVLGEYEAQYKDKKGFSLETSQYPKIINFADDDWKQFLGKIEWLFHQGDIAAIEEKLLAQIRAIDFGGPVRQGMEQYIMAMLYYQLDLRHAKQKAEDRFLDRKDFELIFRRAKDGDIDENSFKYLSIDYGDLARKTTKFLGDYIKNRYHVITGRKVSPVLLPRRIAFFDPSVHTTGRDTEMATDRQKQVFVNFGDQVPFDQPVMLFGDLGSGKSTFIAEYAREFISKNSGIIPIFIPSAYLRSKTLNSLKNLTTAIDRYVNEEMSFPDGIFRLDHAIKIPKEILLIVDGVDELTRQEAQDILGVLKILKDHHGTIRVIATGRPLELDSLLPVGWLSYSILPLNQREVRVIFEQEALATGALPGDAVVIAGEKITILRGRPEISIIATTPLIACSIFYDLDSAANNKTLGDIVFAILKRRLNWHSLDNKRLEYEEFLSAFPLVVHRQRLLARIAYELYRSASKSMHEAKIVSLIERDVPDGLNKNSIVAQALKYFSHAFFQKTTDEQISFLNAPLLECAVGVEFAERLTAGTTPGSLEVELNLTEDWRPVSFAMTVIRERKDESTVRSRLEKLIHSDVRWPHKNLVQAAVVLAELKDRALALRLFEIARTLSFRAVIPIGREDKLSPLAVANCLMLADGPGFQWFWEEYLDGRHPFNHFDEEVAANILGFYIVARDYVLPTSEVKALNSLVVANKHLVTSFCLRGFPVLALLTDVQFSPNERALLLAQLLNDEPFDSAAEAILRRLHQSGEMSVPILNALETVCGKPDFSQTMTAAALWLEFNLDRALPTTVLNNCLTACTRDDFAFINEKITQLASKDDLAAYLRFLVLAEDKKMAGDAALYLLWSGEKNIALLTPALSRSIDWLTHKYSAVDEVAGFIRSQRFDQAVILAANVPTDNHLGIQPSFWRIFIEALLNSKGLFEYPFEQLVSGMSLFTLPRYPDVRISLTALLKKVPRYKELLNLMGQGLAPVLAYHANSILAACFPGDDNAALLTLMKGTFSHHSDKDEWHRFLFTLNFSLSVKEKLHQEIPNFVEPAKTFALGFLYFQGYPLTSAEIAMLTNGLLGLGHRFDASLWLASTDPSFLANHRVFDTLLQKLDDPNPRIADIAASSLLSYHKGDLTVDQLAKAYSLQTKSFTHTFYRLPIDEPDLFRSEEFKAAVIGGSLGQPSLLDLYFRAGQDVGLWEEFFKTSISRSFTGGSLEMDRLYFWIINILRLDDSARQYMGIAVESLLKLPGNQEERRVYPFLLLFGDELGLTIKDEIKADTSKWDSSRDEEIILALAIRAGIQVSSLPPGQSRSWYIIFSQYHSSALKSVSDEDLKLFAADTQKIPSQLMERMGSLLFYGQLTQTERKAIGESGNIGAIIDTIVGFCRGEEFAISRFLEITQASIFPTGVHDSEGRYLNILENVASVLLQTEEDKPKYVLAIRSLLTTDDPFMFHRYLIKLFVAGEQPTIDDVRKLLRFLSTWDRIIDIGVAYYLSNYFASHVPDEHRIPLAEEIDGILGSMILDYGFRSPDNYLLALWVLSLAVIHLQQKVSINSERAFLLGLQSVYIDKSSLGHYPANGHQGVNFPGQDLFNYTAALFEKISIHNLKTLYESGTRSNIPELRATCRFLWMLSGNYSNPK